MNQMILESSSIISLVASAIILVFALVLLARKFYTQYKNKEAWAVVSELGKLAEDAVSITERYVAELKSNGKWDKEAMTTALNSAVTLIRSNLSDKSQSYLDKTVDNVTLVLEEYVESVIRRIHNAKDK